MSDFVDTGEFDTPRWVDELTDAVPATQPVMSGIVGYDIDGNGNPLDYERRAMTIRDNHPTPVVTTRTLPQAHCPDVADHDAHVGYLVRPNGAPGGLGLKAVRCPGRYTPRLHRAPEVGPKPGWTPENPFAGIPGAADDDEES